MTVIRVNSGAAAGTASADTFQLVQRRDLRHSGEALCWGKGSMEQHRYTSPPGLACLKPEIKSFYLSSKYIVPPTGNKGSRLSPRPLRAPKSGLGCPTSCTFFSADKGQMPWSPEHPSLKSLCHMCWKGMKLCFAEDLSTLNYQKKILVIFFFLQSME